MVSAKFGPPLPHNDFNQTKSQGTSHDNTSEAVQSFDDPMSGIDQSLNRKRANDEEKDIVDGEISHKRQKVKDGNLENKETGDQGISRGFANLGFGQAALEADDADDECEEQVAKLKEKNGKSKENNRDEWVDVKSPKPVRMDGPRNRASNVDEIPPNPQMDAFGIQFTSEDVMASLRDGDEDVIPPVEYKKNTRYHKQISKRYRLVPRRREDFFGRLAENPELVIDVTRYFSVTSLIHIYAISKDVHEIINGHISHFMKSYAKLHFPESAKIFVFHLYGGLCMPDPVGRDDGTGSEIPRMVPTLRWLQMIRHRTRVVRDILALMARDGHRMPKTMQGSLKRMWIIMDIASTRRRAMLVHNEQFMTDNDIYNIQLFVIKLDMRFNDPLAGPEGEEGLRKLMLGQKGLTPLRDLLKRTRFTSEMEVAKCLIRYAHVTRTGHQHLPVFGIPANEIGIGHREGWGRGVIHLMRPDELIPREAARRRLNLNEHLLYMMVWGHVDLKTGKTTIVTDEEMYMSDEKEDEKQLPESGWLPLVKRYGDAQLELHESEVEWESEVEGEQSRAPQ